MDACRAGRVHRRQHRGRAQSVRGAHRPALTRRTASAARAAPGPAAVVRSVRPGHPDARLRRRRAAPLPALQAGRHSQPRQPCPAAGPRPSPFNCATAVLRSPTVSVTNLACRQDPHPPCRIGIPINRIGICEPRSAEILFWAFSARSRIGWAAMAVTGTPFIALLTSSTDC